MIKAIVISEVSVLEGAEAMELGIRIATETEFKYIWHRDMARLVLGNVPWANVDTMGGSGINGILDTHNKNRLAYTFGKGSNKLVHVYDWGSIINL
jgi:hypothetical protein